MDSALVNPADAAVHLRFRYGRDDLGIGSGLLYRRNGAAYIVTAWHCVTGRHTETLKPICTATAGIPDNMVATICCRAYQPGYEGSIRRAFTILLEESGVPIYWVHPQRWPRVDVAVVPIELDRRYPCEFVDAVGNEISMAFAIERKDEGIGLSFSITCIQETERVPPDVVDPTSTLSIADEIFVVGYPRGVTDSY